MLFLVLALTGPTASVPPSVPSSDPCAIVTPIEVSALLGATATTSASEGPVSNEDLTKDMVSAQRVLAVVLGGDGLGDPLRRRAALWTMTAAATGRL